MHYIHGPWCTPPEERTPAFSPKTINESCQAAPGVKYDGQGERDEKCEWLEKNCHK
jgi:hypothetical protein